MGADSFISFGVLDAVDILLVAFVLYELYRMAKGTTAMTIFVVISALYVLWQIVRVFNMELTSTILGQVMGVGLLALIIVFQQEIRRFLLYMGNRYTRRRPFAWHRILRQQKGLFSDENIEQIAEACVAMSRTKTGALLVITRQNDLQEIAEAGVLIDGALRARLIENVFFKNSPLHDGALLVHKGRLEAAQCILPLSSDPKIPRRLGLRHRAALGLTEETDALVIVVSEETGMISLVENGKIAEGFNREELQAELKRRTML